jgi:hypothetical protein
MWGNVCRKWGADGKGKGGKRPELAGCLGGSGSRADFLQARRGANARVSGKETRAEKLWSIVGVKFDSLNRAYLLRRSSASAFHSPSSVGRCAPSFARLTPGTFWGAGNAPHFLIRAPKRQICPERYATLFFRSLIAAPHCPGAKNSFPYALGRLRYGRYLFF